MNYITSVERIYMKKGWEKGWKEGRQEGWQEGQQNGERTLLLRQLQHRFGLLSDHYKRLVAEAHDNQLLLWGESLLDAKKLDEVFGE